MFWRTTTSVTSLIVAFTATSWASDVQAQRLNRDRSYIEIHGGVLAQFGADESVGIFLGPGLSLGLGTNFNHLYGVNIGFDAGFARRTPELLDGPVVDTGSFFLELELMQDRPKRQDFFFSLGPSLTATNFETYQAAGFGLRAGAGVDFALTEPTRQSRWWRSESVISLGLVGNVAWMSSDQPIDFPVRFDLFLRFQVKYHGRIP